MPAMVWNTTSTRRADSDEEFYRRRSWWPGDQNFGLVEAQKSAFGCLDPNYWQGMTRAILTDVLVLYAG